MQQSQTLSPEAVEDARQYLEELRTYHKALNQELSSAKEIVIRAVIDRMAQ